jgi:hypothetical protein
MPSILNATTSSGLVTSADNSGSLQLATNNGTTAVTIDTSQNVGIGTASPTGKLTVSAGANEVATFISTVDANADLFLKATGTTLGNVRLRVNANDMAFITGLAETARITSTGLMQFNSGYGSVATAYGCRAWVNFNGTGTPAIRASGNVSSITDNAAGDFTVNFTNALVDTNYCVNAWARGDATTNIVYGWVSSTSTGTKTTSAVRIISGMQQDGITYRSADSAEIGVSVFR